MNYYYSIPFRRSMVMLFIFMMLAIAGTAQPLSGVKTVDASGSGGNNYTTLKAVIDSLNLHGVGAGGVTINVAGGFTETAPLGGYILGSTVLNASLSAANPLVIQKDPLAVGANPLLTAYIGNSTTADGIFKIAGVDYLTIDGINLTDTNKTTPTAMEAGYAFVNLNATAPFDGCQNNTIKNCTITMYRINPNISIGIYGGHNTASSTAALTITNVADAHSNNKILSNNISNVSIGIYIAGFADVTPFALYDQNNEVGGAMAGTGNTITNYGGNPAANSFGIALVNQGNAKASFNNVNGVASANQNIGIYGSGTNSTFTATNNKVTITQAAGTNLAAGIYGAVTGNVIMTNDTVFLNPATGANGTHYGLFSASITTANMSSNHVRANSTGAVTGTFGLIYQNASATGTVTMNDNTFGSSTLNTTGTVYLLYCSNATNNIVVNNNATTGPFNKTGVGNTLYGYYDFGVPTGGTATISGNTFSNMTVTGATGFYGIHQASNTTQTEKILNNTIYNITGGSSTMYGLYLSYGSTGNMISGNTVRKMTGTSTIYGIQVGGTASTNLDVNNNTIDSITTTGGATAYGIQHTSGVNSRIFNNKITEITANNATGIVNGINVTAGTLTSVYNNYISALKAPITSSTSSAIIGINVTSTTTSSAVNLYHNTIYLNGTSSGTNFSTSGIFHTTSATATTAALTIKNNIVVNNCTFKGSGVVAAYRRSGTALGNFSTNSNNNIFYAGTPSPTSVIFYDGTNKDTTIVQYKTRVAPRETVSGTENVAFINSATTPYDLHINASTPTQIEGGAAVISGITTDFDGDARTSTPDIGADEGTFTLLDAQGPSISYNLLIQTGSLLNRNFSAEISDATGVNTTAGTKPRIYYRKKSNTDNAFNGNTNSTPGWKYTEATNSSTPFTFVIDYSLLNVPPAPGDTIQYFVVAQDNSLTPLVSYNLGVLATSPTSVDVGANFPLTGPINSFKIVPTIAANVTVGSGGTYPTLTGAGGLFDAINTGSMIQDVTASVISNLNEPATFALNPFFEEGAGNWHLKIVPSAATIDSIYGTFTGSLIRLNGADRVTIDGSFSGSGRYLIFNNKSTAAGTSVIHLISTGVNNGATNNIVRNCEIIGGNNQQASTNTSIGLLMGSSTISAGSAGADNDNNSFVNNYITGVRYGIVCSGQNSTNPNQNTKVDSNLIGPSLGAELGRIGKGGIIINNEDGIRVSYNEIRNVGIRTGDAAGGTDRVGIALATDATWTPTSTYVRGARIFNNYIHDIFDEKTFSAAGITVAGTNGTNPTGNKIYNNFIAQVKANGTSGDQTVGIGISNGRNDTIAHNSVYLKGDLDPGTSSSSSTSSFGVSISSTTPVNLVFKNNIINCDVTSNTGTLKHAAMNVPTSYAWGTGGSNQNIFWAPPANPQSKIGAIAGTTFHATLALFATATTQDAGSFSEDPLFTDSLNLHINAGVNPSLAESKGVVIAGISKDIDGDVRPGPVGSVNGGAVAPDIGADEFDGVQNLGDLVAPTFALDSIRPLVNTCLNTPHTFYATATDASGIDSVIILWDLGSSPAITQTPILMTRMGNNKFQGQIPANIDSLIAYSFRTVDSSSNHNVTSTVGGTYRDITYTVAATADPDTVAAGSTSQLMVTSPKAGTLGLGTGVNAQFSNIACPYATYYGNGRQQYLIKASELLAMGFSAGNINSIGFDVAAPIPAGANRTLNGMTMKLANVSASSITTMQNPSGATQVFGPVNYLPVLGINTHTFTTPFAWDGTSNVLVDICFANGVTGASTDQWFVRQTPTTGFSSSVYYQVDGSAPTVCGTTNLTAAPQARPNMIITGAAPVLTATWVEPTGGALSATNVVSPTATPLTAGTYNYTVTGSNGLCSASTSVNLVVVPAVVPVADFTASSVLANVGTNVTTVTFTDHSTNLPNSWQWTFTPSTVTYVNSTSATSRNPQVQFLVPGKYTVKLKVSNSAGVDSLIKTDYITANIGYCSSGASNPADDDIGMFNVLHGTDTVFTHGADAPITNNASSVGTYTNYYDTTSVQTFSVSKNVTYTFDVATIYKLGRYNTGISAYIDFNKDGDFTDVGEGFYLGYLTTSLNPNHIKLNITIPCSADTGITRMRLIAVETNNALQAPCAGYTWGETEDYRIRIVDNPMHYVYSTANQITGDVLVNVTNQQVIQIPVVAAGCGANLPLTAFNISTNGTTSLSDIANAKIWYTGTHKTFADTSLFGTATPAANFTITGSKTLLTDTNYFWLTYDITPGAVIGHFIDAEATSIVVNGTTEIPAVTAPAGNRLINVPATYVSNSTIQQSGLVFLLSKNNPIIRTRINMSSSGGPANLSQMKFALTGTTDKVDISKVSLYYTGHGSSFGTGTLVDTAVSITDTITFNKSLSILTDSNYFWLAFDIKATAVLGNFVDAELLSFTIEGIQTAATSGNPAGSRKISGDYCPPAHSNGTGSGDFITLVQFGAINDANGASPSPYYTFNPFSLFNASFQRFHKDTITLSCGTYTSNDIGVWIDYNQDGLFDNVTEKVGEAFNRPAGPAKIKLPVQIPITATLGITRMRVRETDQASTSLDPCVGYTWGETQDYEINILPAPPGDYYPPDISNIVLTPDSQCTAVAHTVTATITDTTAVDSAWIVWSSNNVAQTPILMSHTGSTYSGVIPAQGKSTISYAIRARDVSINHNTITSAKDNYQDEYFNVSAGPDKYIAVGQTATLSANTTLDKPFRITEISFFNCSVCGTGYQSTWPSYLPTAMYDDNIEISNLSNASADLSNYQFITEGLVHNFTFPPGTIVPANGTVIVHFGTGTTDAANLLFCTGSGSLPSSGTAMGIILKDMNGVIMDAVATNGYTFSGASGVSSSDWTGNIVSPSGVAGTGLYGADMNTDANWSNGTSTTMTMGYFNAGLPSIPSTSVITWTGGLLSGPQTGGTIVTPVHPTLGAFTYYAASTNGVCSYTDTVVVNVITAPTVNLGPDGDICGTSPRVLDAGYPGPGATYQWRKAPSATVLATTQTYAAPSAGSYNVTMTFASMVAKDTITLTAAPALVYNAGSDREMCTGGTITLDAGPGYSSYLWKKGTITVGTTQTINVTSIGDYVIAVTNAGGCMEDDTITVSTVTVAPTVNLGSDQTVCASAGVTLDAGNPGSTYEWKRNGTVLPTTTQTIVANSGTYTVKVNTPTGCEIYDTVVINNLPAPTVSLGPDMGLCASGSIVLNAGNPGLTFEWYRNGTIISGQTAQTLNVTSIGTYMVKVTAPNTCSTYDTIVVFALPSPTVNFGPNQNICPGDSVTLDAGNAGSTYQWKMNGNVLPQTTQSIKAFDAGTYTVLVTGTNGCQGKDTIVINHKAAPNANFNITPNSANGLQVIVSTPTQTGILYSWTMGDGGLRNQANFSYTYAAAGTYHVVLTVTLISTGCKTTHDTTITVTPGSTGIGNGAAKEFKLTAAPNPFSNQTAIKFDLAQSSEVSLEIYDMIGKRVAVLADKQQLTDGQQTFDWNIENNNTGIYFVRLTVDGKTSILRINNVR